MVIPSARQEDQPCAGLFISGDTLSLISEQHLPGYDFRNTAARREDGLFDVLVDHDVATTVDAVRLPRETDDEVVARLVRAAIGHKPN